MTLVFKEVNHITGVKVLGGGARSRDYLERFVLLYEEEETKILRPILSHDAITPMVGLSGGGEWSEGVMWVRGRG